MPSFRGLPKFKDIIKDTDGSISPTTSQLTAPDKLVKMEILAIDKVYSSAITKLSINPTTISERKASNWVKHNVPGQSDPLLQWINGSSRVLSFTAIVTKDTAENLTVKGVDSLDNVTVKVKDSYGKFGDKEINGSSISTAEGKILERLKPSKDTTINIPGLDRRDSNPDSRLWFRSITPYLEYYRSLVIPRTSNRNDRSKTPPLIELRMGSLLGNEDVATKDRWVLESYSITITKMSPDLKPIEASVGFTFIEYVDKSKEVNVSSSLDILNSSSIINKGTIDSNVPTIISTIDSKNSILSKPRQVVG